MSPQPLPLETPRTRIVIVDDDDLFRESLGLNLAEQGFEVVDFLRGDVPPEQLCFCQLASGRVAHQQDLQAGAGAVPV